MASRLIAAILLVLTETQGIAAAYYGPSIGQIQTIQHGVKGKVFAASDKNIYMTELHYDGKGPAAHFWAGKFATLNMSGDELPDEKGSDKKLPEYTNAIVYLTLPHEITHYKAFGIFCKQAAVDFGHAELPPNFKPPKEQSLGKLTAKVGTATAADVILKDSATMQLSQFEYDASCAGSSFFMAAPDKTTPADKMTKLQYSGKTDKLDRFAKQDVMLMLPAGHHWNEFKWFSVYCVDTKASHAELDIDMAKSEMVPVHMASTTGPGGQGPPPGPDDKTKDGGKGDAGPLSTMSLLTLIVAAVTTALMFRQCFEEGQSVRRS